ncbi:MAG: hypothetical protein OXR62_12770 [Ahrensia sp.]|nr:hypothetical protein [Ahrensia sp.]
MPTILGAHLFFLALLVLPVAAETRGETQWVPANGSWHQNVIDDFWTNFDKQSFDKIYWADKGNLRIIRPSLGIRQDLLANHICKSVVVKKMPIDQVITLKFFDTMAHEEGRLEEHASVICNMN